MSEKLILDPEDATDVASAMVGATHDMLISTHHEIALKFTKEEHGKLDAAPMLGGVLGGMAAFMMDGGLTDEAIADMMSKMLNEVLPQIRLQWEVKERGGPPGVGNA